MADHADLARKPAPQSATAQRAGATAPPGHAPAVEALGQTAQLLNARPAVAAQRALAEQLSAAKPVLQRAGAEPGAAGPTLHPSSPRSGPAGPSIVMRRVDPDFDTFRGAGAGPATKVEMQNFYNRFVAPEETRFSNRPIDDVSRMR
jgi:hypothetical protein